MENVEQSKRSLGSTLVLALGTFAVGMDAFIVSAFLPEMAEDLSVSASMAGWSVTAFALAYALLAPVIATMTSTVARRRLLVSSLLLLGLANIASAACMTLGLLILTRIAAAASAAAYTPNAGGDGCRHGASRSAGASAFRCDRRAHRRHCIGRSAWPCDQRVHELARLIGFCRRSCVRGGGNGLSCDEAHARRRCHRFAATIVGACKTRCRGHTDANGFRDGSGLFGVRLHHLHPGRLSDPARQFHHDAVHVWAWRLLRQLSFRVGYGQARADHDACLRIPCHDLGPWRPGPHVRRERT